MSEPITAEWLAERTEEHCDGTYWFGDDCYCIRRRLGPRLEEMGWGLYCTDGYGLTFVATVHSRDHALRLIAALTEGQT